MYQLIDLHCDLYRSATQAGFNQSCLSAISTECNFLHQSFFWVHLAKVQYLIILWLSGLFVSNALKMFKNTQKMNVTLKKIM